ncbi:retinol dehydrogenase 7-like [Pleurodeles waltl]|uniref:retinol dehydrogenase 7-like n=1 Tax=Pleurodeles waltl TaxID=8319 RepID=UPI00370937B5
MDMYVTFPKSDEDVTGFGNLLARNLDKRGMHVLAACLTQEGAEQLNEVTSQRLQTINLDISNSENVAAMAEWVKQQVGDKGLWGLVNNACVGFPMAPSEWLTKDDFAKVINVNLLCMIDVTLSLLPLVRKCKGRIVNMSSAIGRMAIIGGGYCISKYGVEAFSDSLRRNINTFGVTVSIVVPGCFNTGFATKPKVQENLHAVWDRVPNDVKESYGQQYYNTYFKNLEDLSTTGNPNLHLVVDSLQHAVTAVYPRSRYSPGWDSKFYYLPFSYFPTIIADYVLTRSSPRPGQ